MYCCLPILVLATTVVGMEDEIHLSQAVVLQVVVEEGDDTVTSLPHAHPLTNEVVDLLKKVCDVLCCYYLDVPGVVWPHSISQRGHTS